MTLNNKNLIVGGVSYETPSIKTLDFLSEGVLCVSSTGMTIDDAVVDDWGTI